MLHITGNANKAVAAAQATGCGWCVHLSPSGEWTIVVNLKDKKPTEAEAVQSAALALAGPDLVVIADVGNAGGPGACLSREASWGALVAAMFPARKES